MEHILANAGDDRFVRLSAAYGLAEVGPARSASPARADLPGVRRRRGAAATWPFARLTSLNDERPLPFMRQVVASEAEPSYRLRAIQYLTAQGDRQSLPTLQVLMQSPTEQASIRDAAAQAYTDARRQVTAVSRGATDFAGAPRAPGGYGGPFRGPPILVDRDVLHVAHSECAHRRRSAKARQNLSALLDEVKKGAGGR